MFPDKFELSCAFFNRRQIEIGINTGVIQSLEHEDGSTFNYNIVLMTREENVHLFYNMRRQAVTITKRIKQ